MKKLLCLCLALGMLLTLTACDPDQVLRFLGEADRSAEPLVDEISTAPATEEEKVQPFGALEPLEMYEVGSLAAMDMPMPGGGGYYTEPLPPVQEQYLAIDENRVKYTTQEPLSTFSLKVDTASYSNVERYIQGGGLPPADAVRTEELINYFRYEAPLEFGDAPFAIQTEIGPSPFSASKYLLYARVKARDIDKEALPSSNLTFLIDTSGSMDSYDKLPLLKEAFSMLVETLDADDRVSIVTYAGSAGVPLAGASGAEKEKILDAIHNLDAGGSTAGAEGIQTAYELAEANFLEGGNNRVILATDGDFNVGISDTDSLAKLISKKRDSGIYLSILGFGTGNIRDDIMETLSKEGNGNYAYIHSTSTARKVLVEELAANLYAIADDVKAQIEFNPRNVKSYRLIGYENRRLANEDFNDDTKDAGEIGVGTDVVLLYEIELTGSAGGASGSVDLKYEQEQTPVPAAEEEEDAFAGELLELRIRYKEPGESESKLLLHPVTRAQITQENSTDFGFASAVASFGHLLRESEYAQGLTIDEIIRQAEANRGQDADGYRRSFVDLLHQYRAITR